MYAFEAEQDGLEVGIEAVRRDGDDPFGKGIIEQALVRIDGFVLDDELVIDILCRDVHEREVEGPFVGSPTTRKTNAGWASYGH
jgi:hypothetical protein